MFELLRQLSETLSALHDYGVAHQDIKPGNLLYKVEEDDRHRY